MAEGGVSVEARQRFAKDQERQQKGVLQHVLREEAGIHDFRPGDSELTPADQAAFNTHLEVMRRRESVNTPKSLLRRFRDLVGI